MSEQTPSGTEEERDAFPYEGAESDGSGTAQRSDAPHPDTPSPAEGADKDRYARARDDEEPGSHSGGESQAQERVVPGTASAAEGYRTEDGTAHGDPLAGVEKSEAEGTGTGRTGDPEEDTAEGGEDRG
ncbi:hypothetical protein [Streptomyces caelestis]|uniref:hypothetical protein n=1 Tax=Streptomyces caelestis TaxID=36816 RepID=UPI0036638047